MLSRVAERVYWMSRYLERVESAARLVNVYGELLLDLPADAGLDWSVALQILGMEESYRNSAGKETELNFLLHSQDNIASVLNSLNFARENARTTRDIVPSEAWRAVNELHLYARDKLPSLARRPGSRVPAEIVGRCQQITGILEGTMSHGPAYHFVRLGRSLERADMTSRMIDVAAAIMLTGREELQMHSSTIWRAVLRSLSAYQMYRQFVRRRILGDDVIRFLLLDEAFPRSVRHCILALEDSLKTLPRHENTAARMSGVSRRIESIKLDSATYETLHQFADELQIELAGLHAVIFETWLNPMKAV
jgi:uncharacterized alpha-E superfamily protein